MGLPQFTSTFIDTLKQMQAADNPTRQKLLFKKFYDTYGTDYITEVKYEHDVKRSTFIKAFSILLRLVLGQRL